MSSRHWTDFSRTALSVAVAIVAAAPAMAQNTTSAVSGRITSADGKAVAGASVVVRHLESGSTSNLVTDSEGRYSARGLRVGGPYSIVVSKGADKQTRDDVYLALAETAALDFTLGGNVLSTVVVSGSSAAANKFNVGAQGAGTNLSRQELDAYASIARNLQDYARTDPRISQTDKERGEISALGQNARFNAVTIDGVRTNDTFGLESNGLPTAKQPISIDAIQSVQVNISNFDVTQQGYTGANINAVTKSGTNEFKGSLYYVYRNDKLTGQRYSRVSGAYSDTPKFTEDTKGFTLGGPIIKDKLYFFTSYEELHSSRTTPSFGPIGSNLTNVGITSEQIAAATAAATAKGMNIGTAEVPAGTELAVKDTLLKLDWNISESHRANLRYSKTDQKEPLFYGVNNRSLALNSHWSTESKVLETLVGQWFADWTPDFSTEVKVSNRDYSKGFLNNSDLPQVSLIWTTPSPAGTQGGNRTLLFGTEASRHYNELKTKTLDGYIAGNLIMGDHEIKAGADYSRNEIFNAFLQQTKGSYVFQGTDPVAQFIKGTPTSYSVQLPKDSSKTLADGAGNWTLSNVGLFAQDTWTINKKLSIVAGLRIDQASTNDHPIANPDVKTAFGYDNSVSIDGQKLLQPRFGFNYSLDAVDKKRSQVRGGFGLFQGSAANVWLTNPYQNTGMATAQIACANTGTPCSTVMFSPDPNKQPVIAGQAPIANVDILSPNAKQPSVWKLNLAYDTELPWHGLVAGAEWIYTKTKDGITFRHLNLGAPTLTGTDGREMYYDSKALDAGCWNGGTAFSCAGKIRAGANSKFGNVLLAERTSKGDGNALTLSLSQQNQGWGWQAAYTRTSATEVSPLTSSTAGSNYYARSILNPNEDVAANSSYLIRDRISAAVNWSKVFIGSYKTTVGLFYEGRQGKPYSWTFNNDMNGDGIFGNDLMYIPKAPGSGEVLFYGKTAAERQANEDKFWAVVDSNPDLNAARGGVIKRNTSFMPIVHNFDLRLSQEVPGFSSKHKGVFTFDILNVGNLLNKRWGRVDEILFQGSSTSGSGGANPRSFVNFAGMQDGKYVYNTVSTEDYTTRQNKGESQWALQVTLKYQF